MKCLAVNTATKTLSLAIVDNEKVLHRFETPDMRDQGNLLLQHIQDGLKKNNLSYADLDVLAVVTGPGSFTGIRVGLATMRGISLAADKPLIGITSFDMFARPGKDIVNVVAVESWREELYFAVLDEEGHPFIPCMNVTPEVFHQRFQHELPGIQEVVISGDAKMTASPFFPQGTCVDEDANAVDVARVALKRFSYGGTFAKPVPYYMRNADVTISAKKSRTLKAQEE